MLPPFIIEQIRRREEREAEERRRRQHEQPRLEIPVDVHRPASEPPEDDDSPDRGVVIVDIG